jgi:hypothetical protein
MRKLWVKAWLTLDNVVGKITKLKQQPGKDLIIDGSATTVQSLLGTGLIA